ncbi:hypothetical protein [Pararhizobium mangrovi]|uniref:hypothetical protein n=1 Tax=Pararhizobium mangrovi TaxID=2590452 RepID=UPI0015E8654F|nr:hypothetical protein [Pararhizobium mangrovi]
MIIRIFAVCGLLAASSFAVTGCMSNRGVAKTDNVGNPAVNERNFDQQIDPDQ